LTQLLFADRTGRSKSWVVKVEGGARSAGHLPILDVICEVLQVDLSTLIGQEPGRATETCLGDAEVEQIQSALERYRLNSPADPSILVESLRRRVAHAWSAFEAADYQVVGSVLPALIEDGQDGYRSSRGAFGPVLVEIYQLTASSLRKLGEHSLAWLAGDRGMHIADQDGDAALIAATGFRVANALLSMGRPRQAKVLNTALAEHLHAQVHGEADRALYGHVLLQAAVAAGADGDPAAVRDLTAEASDAARFVTAGSNHHRLSFNTTNVALHQISAQLALGEGGRAVELAETLDGAAVAMLRKERRAALLVEIARANSQIGCRDQALRNLLDAEVVASREVICRPVAQSTVAELLRRYGALSRPHQLTQLAERCGVTDYEG
jgi:transcriptional regulator with XRE-family HTH domain